MKTLAILLAVALAAPAAPAADKGKKKWRACELQVTNSSPFRIQIHVDGVYWGWVSAQRSFTFTGIPEGDVIVYGDTQYAEYHWGPQPMKCKGTITWQLAL